jgi:nitroreductase
MLDDNATRSLLGEELETYFATARTVRKFAPRPVDRASLESLVWAATRAPSPGNTQPWQFVIVQDELTKIAIQRLVVPRLEYRRETRDAVASAAGETILTAVDDLVNDLSSAPALIICCGDVAPFADSGGRRFLWSAVYPAIGYMLIAARAAGLGSALTMLHLLAENKIRELIGIPPTYDICATVVVGYPAQPFTEVRRVGAETKIHWNRWS